MGSAGSIAFFSVVQLSPAAVHPITVVAPTLFGKIFSCALTHLADVLHLIACYFSCGYSMALFMGASFPRLLLFSMATNPSIRL
jgi:hypothetical protein